MTAHHASAASPMELRPRIWNEWDVAFYGSGTTTVCQKSTLQKPWLYIYADASADDDRYMRDRYAMCYQIRDYMNGTAPRPVWLDDFERVSETELKALSGGLVFATGPIVDADPPNLDWRQDDSDDARNDRARLIDALTFTGVVV